MKTKLTYSEILVTPEIANEWLEGHTNFRDPSKGTVERYAESMIRGEWELNGEPLAFNSEGELKNGQHRLLAVVKSGVPVLFSVLEGVDSDLYDKGKVRSLAEYLSFTLKLDKRSSGFLATASGWLYRWDNDKLLTNESPSEQQTLDLIQNNPLITEAVSYVREQFESEDEWALTSLLPPGMAVFLRYKIMLSDPEKGNSFFKELIKETNPDPNSVTRVLSNRLKYYRHEKSKKHQRDICSLVINCWSLYKNGESPENPKSIKTPRKLSRKLEF